MRGIRAAVDFDFEGGVDADHPSGNHTPTFDVDERSIEVGVKVIARTAAALAGDDQRE